MEPDDAQGAVSRNRFYLMPILKVDTPFEGTKLLEVASIDPGSAGDKPDANAPKDARTMASRARASQWSSTRPFP